MNKSSRHASPLKNDINVKLKRKIGKLDKGVTILRLFVSTEHHVQAQTTYRFIMNAESPFQDSIMLQLKKFTRAAWGNSGHILLTSPDSNVEYINLGEYFKALQSLFPAAVKHDKILVRQAYRDALQALKENTRYNRGVFITGQPGIGTFVCHHT